MTPSSLFDKGLSDYFPHSFFLIQLNQISVFSSCSRTRFSKKRKREKRPHLLSFFSMSSKQRKKSVIEIASLCLRFVFALGLFSMSFICYFIFVSHPLSPLTERGFNGFIFDLGVNKPLKRGINTSLYLRFLTHFSPKKTHKKHLRRGVVVNRSKTIFWTK